jgi:RNA polymerase sigma-70 factor (ECF subfamily)
MALLTTKNISETTSDEQILALSVEHPQLFGMIVDRYQVKFLRKMTFVLKDEDAAEDIVQDTFVKIYKNANRFHEVEGATFSSWAYKILFNTCYSYCARRKREKEFFDAAGEEYLEIAQADSRDWEQKLDTDEFLSKVKKIPLALGRILSLHFLEGKTYEDLAEKEEVSLGAMRTRMHRAKEAFKKVI